MFGGEGKSMLWTKGGRQLNQRRWCFNITLFIAGTFGLASGGANNFLSLAALLATMGIGVGGTIIWTRGRYVTHVIHRKSASRLSRLP